MEHPVVHPHPAVSSDSIRFGRWTSGRSLLSSPRLPRPVCSRRLRLAFAAASDRRQRGRLRPSSAPPRSQSCHCFCAFQSSFCWLGFLRRLLVGTDGLTSLAVSPASVV